MIHRLFPNAPQKKRFRNADRLAVNKRSEEAAILRFFTSFVSFFLSRLTEIRRFRYETVYSMG